MKRFKKTFKKRFKKSFKKRFKKFAKKGKIFTVARGGYRL